jgi:hypothetical protein
LPTGTKAEEKASDCIFLSHEMKKEYTYNEFIQLLLKQNKSNGAKQSAEETHQFLSFYMKNVSYNSCNVAQMASELDFWMVAWTVLSSTVVLMP